MIVLYIPDFWAGVIATVLFEMAVVIIMAVAAYKKK